MAEIEAKVILPGCEALARIEQRLRELGATMLEEVEEEDTYYQHPCRDFSQTDEALRLRLVRTRHGQRYELTYKGPKKILAGAKAREEYSTGITSPADAEKILESLGFSPVAVVRKKRKYYRAGDILVSLDTVHGLGCFLEAEYRGTHGADKAVTEINKLLEAINAQNYPRTEKSYLELILETGTKQQT